MCTVNQLQLITQEVAKQANKVLQILRKPGVGPFIALALLPEGTDLNSRLHFECFEYTLL